MPAPGLFSVLRPGREFALRHKGYALRPRHLFPAITMSREVRLWPRGLYEIACFPTARFLQLEYVQSSLKRITRC